MRVADLSRSALTQSGNKSVIFASTRFREQSRSPPSAGRWHPSQSVARSLLFLPPQSIATEAGRTKIRCVRLTAVCRNPMNADFQHLLRLEGTFGHRPESVTRLERPLPSLYNNKRSACRPTESSAHVTVLRSAFHLACSDDRRMRTPHEPAAESARIRERRPPELGACYARI
jgi:hypothetical protein